MSNLENYNPCDFSGDFITMPTTKTIDEVSAFHFKKSFKAAGKIKSATLLIVGLGCQKTYINHVDIRKDEILLTPTSNANHTVYYNRYDVTSFIKSEEENQLDIICGNGFFNDCSDNAWNFNKASWRDYPMLKASLSLLFEDDSACIIQTNDSFLVTDVTPITFNNFRCGIYYDSRIKAADSDFVFAVLANKPKGALILLPSDVPPVKIVNRFKPIAMWKVGDSYVFDVGVNTTGFCELSIKGEIGQEITLRYGELLNKDKSLDQSNIDCYVKSHPSQLHKYIIGSKEVETFSPDFTYCGFRYVQLDGLYNEPDLDTITICEAWQNLTQRGEFSCSNELINTIEKLAKHSAITNFCWVPTDCPHREKNGWTGDAQVSCEQFMFHYDAAAAYKRWLCDITYAMNEKGQLPGFVPTDTWGYDWGNGPAWDASMFILPYNIYMYDGDTEGFSLTFAAMERYLDYLKGISDNLIVKVGLGDWCPPNNDESDGFDCPNEITDSAYFYNFAQIAEVAAAALGYQDKALSYKILAADIKAAFLNKFVNLDEVTILSNSQTAISCLLYHHLLPLEKEQAFADKLYNMLLENDFAHTVGILGFKYIFTALTQHGYLDAAYELAIRTQYPSIGYWIEHGATSLYERWQETQSRNHHMFSCISDWFFKYIGGLQIEEAGFAKYKIYGELPSKLNYSKVTYHKKQGFITVTKTRTENGEVKVEVTEG